MKGRKIMDGMNVVFVPVDRTRYVNRTGIDNRDSSTVFDYKQTTESDIPADIKKEQIRKIAELLEKNGKIDPSKDKVFYNPKTGELDTIKPGLICPKHDNSNAKKGLLIGGLLGLGVTGALAFVFRKPIGKVLSSAAGVLKTAAGSISDTFKNVLNKIKK